MENGSDTVERSGSYGVVMVQTIIEGKGQYFRVLCEIYNY